jgi:hypothetical protein
LFGVGINSKLVLQLVVFLLEPLQLFFDISHVLWSGRWDQAAATKDDQLHTISVLWS